MSTFSKQIIACSALWTAALALLVYGNSIESPRWAHWGLFIAVVAATTTASLVGIHACTRIIRAIDDQREDVTKEIAQTVIHAALRDENTSHIRR